MVRTRWYYFNSLTLFVLWGCGLWTFLAFFDIVFSVEDFNELVFKIAIIVHQGFIVFHPSYKKQYATVKRCNMTHTKSNSKLFPRISPVHWICGKWVIRETKLLLYGRALSSFTTSPFSLCPEVHKSSFLILLKQIRIPWPLNGDYG